MKLPYAKGLPLPAAVLMVSPGGACVFAALKQDETVVQESGNGPTGSTLTEKKQDPVNAQGARQFF